MLKKTITYNDLDGNLVSEDFYFNYTAAEITELEYSENGGLSNAMQRIIATSDIQKILALFKQIVGGAVGKRSEDGKHFVKTEEYKNEFLSSEAYSELFVELISKPDYAAQFITQLVPKNLQDRLEGANAADNQPDWLRDGRAPSQDELKNATPQQIQQAFALRASKPITQ